MHPFLMTAVCVLTIDLLNIESNERFTTRELIDYDNLG